MASAAVGYLNLADAGTVTAVSSQATTMPATNVQNVHVQRRWRSLVNSANFVIDLGASKSVDTVGVFGMTMSASGTIRIRLSTSDATGAAGDAYDSGVVAVVSSYNAHVSLVTAPVTARYFRADLSDAAATYVEAGRVFIGVRTPLTYNFAYGWQKGFVDRSIKSKTRGGQTQVWLDNHYRILDVTFSTVTRAQRNAVVEDIDRINGQSTDVLFIIDPASSVPARDSIWGLITDATPVVQSYFGVFSKQYKIEERL